MGILSGLKKLNDERKERNEEKRLERRAARLEAIEEFIKREYGVTDLIKAQAFPTQIERLKLVLLI